MIGRWEMEELQATVSRARRRICRYLPITFLTPQSVSRNLERELKCRVIDRTGF